MHTPGAHIPVVAHFYLNDVMASFIDWAAQSLRGIFRSPAAAKQTQKMEFFEKWHFNTTPDCPKCTLSETVCELTTFEGLPLIKFSKWSNVDIFIDSFFCDSDAGGVRAVRAYLKGMHRTMLGLLNDLLIFAGEHWFSEHTVMWNRGTVILEDLWSGAIKHTTKAGAEVIYTDIDKRAIQDAMVNVWKIITATNKRIEDLDKGGSVQGLASKDYAIFQDMKRRLGKLYHPASSSVELTMIEPVMLHGYYGLILESRSSPAVTYLSAVVGRLTQTFHSDKIDTDEEAYAAVSPFFELSDKAQEDRIPLLTIPAARSAFDKFKASDINPSNAMKMTTAAEYAPDLALRWPYYERLRCAFTDLAV
jgi:hypothetical protein